MKLRCLVCRCLPWLLKRWVRRCIDKVALRRLFRSHNPATGKVAVYYGQRIMSGLNQVAGGGQVKLQHMQAALPNAPRDFNLLYLVSSNMHPDTLELVHQAKQKNIPLVWNQNGVAYPAWHGPGWEQTNVPMALLLHGADYVFFQSEFCKRSSQKFLGTPQGASEVLYNPVDTRMFCPGPSRSTNKSLVLLLAGTHGWAYRVETALKVLALVIKQQPGTVLQIAGRLCWLPNQRRCRQQAQQWIEALGLEDHVTFRGPYTQHEAVELYRGADVLLHTQVNDACPGVVSEAMACALPVVYSDSGGTGELVAYDAGIGVETQTSWEKLLPLDVGAFARAVLSVAEDRKHYGDAGRRRAVEKFDLQPWLRRHEAVFKELCRCD